MELMGNIIDISHTILGNSLLDKKFVTKVPFYYRKYSDGSEHFSHTYFTEEYEIFNPGMIFKVNKVERIDDFASKIISFFTPIRCEKLGHRYWHIFETTYFHF